MDGWVDTATWFACKFPPGNCCKLFNVFYSIWENLRLGAPMFGVLRHVFFSLALKRAVFCAHSAVKEKLHLLNKWFLSHFFATWRHNQKLSVDFHAYEETSSSWIFYINNDLIFIAHFAAVIMSILSWWARYK